MASRAWTAAEVGMRLSRTLTNAGMTSADSSGNMKEPIDDALRMMGYAEDNLVDPLDPEPSSIDFLTLVEYTALRRIIRNIGDRFDLSTSGRNLRLQQQVATAERMLKAVEADVIRIFGEIPTGLAADTDSPFITYQADILTDGVAVYADEFAQFTG